MTALRLAEFKLTKGHLLFVSQEMLIRSYRGKLLVSRNGGDKWHLLGEQHKKKLFRFGSKFRLIERLLRLGIKAYTSNDRFLVCFTKSNLCIVDLSNGAFRYFDFQGQFFPPLLPSILPDGTLIFGEYHRNQNREPIRIIFFDVERLAIIKSIELRGVRHIHGTFPAPQTGQVLFTTGDSDEESAIWRLSIDKDEPERLVGGSQAYRAVQLLCKGNDVIFGTDAPDHKNFIFIWNGPSGLKPQRLAMTGGPVFFGSEQAGRWLLSTACEPSVINRTDASELWASNDGWDWKPVLECLKDKFSMRYFGYGVLHFPRGRGDGKNIWFSTYAAYPDNIIFCIPADLLV